jgi:glycosyltransferase involved in cell wall biosynthesis
MKGAVGHMTSLQTKVSIITPVLNCVATIGDCIQSVRSQECEAEHIIIDGKSTDGSLDVINWLYHDRLRCFSERDSGMYDAINKGIDLCSGDIVGILNADDFYVHSRVLSRAIGVLEDFGVDSCYGDLVYVHSSNPSEVARYWRSSDYDRLRFLWGWMPPHPTFFVKRSAYEQFGKFRLDMGTAADYELMLRFLFRHGISAFHIPEILVAMRFGGISNASVANRREAHRMDRRAWRVNGLNPQPWTLFLKPASKIWQYIVPRVKAVGPVSRWWNL